LVLDITQWIRIMGSRGQRSMGLRKFITMPPGTCIAGRYLVVRYLCSGGMGDIYEVQHTLLGRRFALKRMPTDKWSEGLHTERFLREARAAAATGHPGIVEVFDLGFAEEGWPYLVMERLRGETLRERLRRGPLCEIEVVHLARSVLDALDAVHRLGMVHRDIKPENIYLCDNDTGLPRIKILDFGLAQLYAADELDVRLTQTGSVVGTPLYMSPEQARGEEIDLRADLYAVGAVLYECVAGHPPFHAEGTYAALVARVLEQLPPVEPLAGIGEGLRIGILRALAKRAEQRCSDAALMRHVLCGEPAFDVTATPSPDVGAVASPSSGAATETASEVSWPTESPTYDDAEALALVAVAAARPQTTPGFPGMPDLPSSTDGDLGISEVRTPSIGSRTEALRRLPRLRSPAALILLGAAVGAALASLAAHGL
jgi:serine/threonine protein kinase